MEKYNNIGGDSGIVGYETGIDYIKVQFKDGAVYLYNYIRPGQIKVEHMKNLAKRGSGLNSYISTSIRKNYASKLR